MGTRVTTLKPRLQALDMRSAMPAPKVVDGFYLSREWKQARGLAVALHANYCVKCGRRAARMFVDHIVELQDGGDPLAQSNLRLLCGACHSHKTAAERARRQRE